MSSTILAILIAAISAFFIGFLFHGPLLGKLWMRLANIVPTGNEKFSNMIPQLIFNFVGNLFSAFALAIIYIVASTSILLGSGVLTAIIISIIIWLGFLVPASSIEVLWMKRRPALWVFECFCSLVSMLVMGLIIGSW